MREIIRFCYCFLRLFGTSFHNRSLPDTQRLQEHRQLPARRIIRRQLSVEEPVHLFRAVPVVIGGIAQIWIMERFYGLTVI